MRLAALLIPRFIVAACVALILVLAGCAPDRGACLASHPEHSDGYMLPVMTPVWGSSGTVSYTTTLTYIPPSDYDQCDRWEFPEGRPK